MDPDDWEELRQQTRDAWELLAREDCQAEPFESPFSWFPATVDIDGTVLEPVGIRKKGFLGSLSEEKPALKLDLTEYADGLAYSGVTRLTLNNAISDPSLVRQCVAYGFFRDAGMPASRCNFASVSVNGEELGIFTNVEPIREEFLGRYWENTGGNLYEGTLSDFREGWTGTLEKKNDESEDDWLDVEALVEAAAAPDDELLDALGAVLDVDAFLTHWAAEVVATHVDGYANNTNNFYLYDDPGTGLFHFIPWGIDEGLQPAANLGEPRSVWANGVLARRLYLDEQGQALYLDRLRALLDQSWDEEVFLERIDAMEALILPELAEAGEVGEAIEQVRGVVRERRDVIMAELEEGAPEWRAELRDDYCIDLVGEASTGFETWWGSAETEDPFSTGSVDLEIVWDGELLPVLSAGAVAGWSEGQAVVFIAAWISDTEAVVVYFVGPEEVFRPGVVGVDLSSTVAALFNIDTATMEDFEFVSYVLGAMTFTEAGTDDGDTVAGTLSGELMAWGR